MFQWIKSADDTTLISMYTAFLHLVKHHGIHSVNPSASCLIFLGCGSHSLFPKLSSEDVTFCSKSYDELMTVPHALHKCKNPKHLSIRHKELFMVQEQTVSSLVSKEAAEVSDRLHCAPSFQTLFCWINLRQASINRTFLSAHLTWTIPTSSSQTLFLGSPGHSPVSSCNLPPG